MIQEIGIQTAKELLDFSHGQDRTSEMWSTQLEGAVAIHNVLVRENIAYLADEVGMGKTYVALGAIALFRHFNPGWRVLYITPNENIQNKWWKELQNFTANNWRSVDNRVKTLQELPAWPMALPSNLADLVREVLANPHRDFVVRMSSFSLGVADDRHAWRERRRSLLESIRWVDESLLESEDKETFKDNYARTINSLLRHTHFDLVVVDEAHNLKHGLQRWVATRNRLIAYVLGHPQGKLPERFPDYGMRFDRLLMLSATPLESDYKEIVNQLQVFNVDGPWRALADPQKEEEEKRSIVSGMLIRRLTELKTGGERYTKNMYRREWRNGGVERHNDPLAMADERQRLIVALVQKKVAEVLGTAKFNNSFQIGMLSSFESFLETARVKREEDQATFDESDQTDLDEEKDGVDTPSINRLTRLYARRFDEPMPHPKMDSVARRLSGAFTSGKKTLVFVRRIRSVDELVEKLCIEYDRKIESEILERLPAGLHAVFRQIVQGYRDERRSRVRIDAAQKGEGDVDLERPDIPILEAVKDEGGKDNFFAWFFRGEGPKGIFSGASLVQNRLSSEASAYSTFFEDNLVAWLIGPTPSVVSCIAQLCKKDATEVESLLGQAAFGIFRERPERKKAAYRKFHVYHAYQEAALDILSKHATDQDLRNRAIIILRQMYGLKQRNLVRPPDRFPKPEEILSEQTFFTAISLHPELRDILWPESVKDDLQEAFKERQIRRELISAVIRLGHPIIDLWILAVEQVGSLAARAEAESDTRMSDLVRSFIDLLNVQRTDVTGRWTSFREIAEVSHNHDLIINTNFPEARSLPLLQLPRYFGRALAKQTPVGGMFGEVNKTMMKQFLMPGYPHVLVTTDVLREGADLHTFCSEVMHYGIAWTPSSMEQRTGRIDRINSCTHRRLSGDQGVRPEEMLQVYYPHLKDTVERLQVERVYERMNQFIRALHRTLAGGAIAESSINVSQVVLDRPRDIEPIGEHLESPFDVKPEWLRPDIQTTTETVHEEMKHLVQHFGNVLQETLSRFEVRIEPGTEVWARYFTLYLDAGGNFAVAGSPTAGWRQQPVAVFLHAHGLTGRTLLRCVSPIGVLPMNDLSKVFDLHFLNKRGEQAKICGIRDTRSSTYNFTVEGDILFHPSTTQVEEVLQLIQTNVRQADRLEREFLPDRDRGLEEFRKDIIEEPRRD